MTLRRRVLLPGCILVWVLAGPAQAELRTADGAIGCLTPDKLPAAEEAQKKRDRMEMDRLGCFPIMTGTSANGWMPISRRRFGM